MIWNRTRECMSRDELAVLQGKRLVELVKYMYHNAEYYRRKMKNLGIEPGDIRGIEDLGKLPFTTREDLMEAYPLGVYAMENSKIVRYHASDHSVGSQSGIETIAGYTQNDIEVWKECMARSLGMANLGERDVIQVAYNYGMCAEGVGAHYGAEKIGAAVVPAPDNKPAALIALMRRLHVTGIISTSSYLMRVAQMIEERGLRKSLQLKSAICEESNWTENIRKKIQDRIGAKIYDIFGLNELTGLGVACECECHKGMHIQEDFFLAEILDTHTLLVLPCGFRGELVFTTLQKEGIPLIRYRTTSITKIHYETCECGRTMARIDRIFGSVNDVLLIRGNSVFVSQLEAVLSNLQDIHAFYVVRIRKEHNLDMVDIYIHSKRNEMLSADTEADLKRRVAAAVCHIIGMMPNIYCGGSELFVKVSIERKVTIVDERGC